VKAINKSCTGALGEKTFSTPIFFSVSIWMIGAIEVFARHGENIVVPNEIAEGSVQIIS
jgi:hypothetical protein